MAVTSIMNSPPSISGEIPCFDIGNEEVVTCEDNDETIEMLSDVTALISAEAAGFIPGFPQQPFTPSAITEEQWPLSFN